MTSTTQKVTLTEKMADMIISKERWKDDEEGYIKVKYGLEVILINLMKFVCVYGIALSLGIFWQTFVVHGSYLCIRRYSFGLHAKKSINCTITSLLMFVLGPWLLQDISANNWVTLIVCMIVLVNVGLFAPADTESLPLIGADRRQILKRKAIISTAILTGVALLVPFAEMKTLIMLGSAYQVVCIHPMTYKILRRGYRNYEIYE